MRCSIGVIALVFILLMHSAHAQTMDEAFEMLARAEVDILEMESDGLPVSRVKDLYNEAKNLFDAQRALERSGGDPDYSFVLSRTSEITKTKEAAFEMRDEIAAVELIMSEITDVDLEQAYEALSEAKSAFDAERFEESKEKVDEIYEIISNLQSTSTKVSAMLYASREKISYFVYTNWLSIFIVIIIIFGFFAVSGKTMLKRLINRRIAHMEFEKEVIKNLIKETQRKYFSGEMAEGVYYIKINKYGEMSREVNRKITVMRSRLKIDELKKKVAMFNVDENEKINREPSDMAIGLRTNRWSIFSAWIKAKMKKTNVK